MKTLKIFLILIFISSTGFSQNSIEFLEDFKADTKSDLYEVKTGKNSFVGISAFVLDLNYSAKLYYKVNSKQTTSEWIELKRNSHDITPDRVVFEGSPILKEVDDIQFKTNIKSTSKVVFRLFLPGEKKEIVINTSEKTENCSCEQPEICDRSCWCPTCTVDPTPEETTPSHIVIHHSAGFTTSDDFAGVVAYYYDLHVNTNGWDDIGYNYLIDANGVIYEGRGNGLQGAHFSCMNTNTVGICVIGNYMTVAPASGAIQNLMNFLAWESCLFDIEVLGASILPIADMELENICSHRDGNDSESVNSCASGTECPGDVLYGLIPTFRDLVSDFNCLQESVGIEEIEEGLSVSVFPVPAIDILNLIISNTAILKVQVYTLSGKKVYSRDYNVETKNISLDISKLIKGVYVINIETANTIIHKKFVKG